MLTTAANHPRGTGGVREYAWCHGPMRARSYVAVWAAALAVAGCAAATEKSAAERTPSAETTAPIAAQTPSAQDAAGDLSDFACTASPDGAGLWSATGTLSNGGAAPASYRVTVVVLDGSAGTGTGEERTVELSAGDSADIDMGRVRGPAEGACQVQVLRMIAAAATAPPR